MTRHVLVLMTAMPPTTGHVDLIEFADSFEDSEVFVLVSGRSFEPLIPEDRANALIEHFQDNPFVTVRYDEDDSAPQNPEDHADFWNWWKNKINTVFPDAYRNWSYVVASEPYGKDVAMSIGAEFMPYDLNREINPIKGTLVREMPFANWLDIIPEYRQRILVTATIFGQESVGKSTTTKAIRDFYPHIFATRFEWARPYLETNGPETTYENMDYIFNGQLALQRTAFAKAERPVLIQDTDLMSTIGYYRIMGWEPPEGYEEIAKDYASDIYYVLGDDIPFEEDPLRYGDGVRQSSKQFWIDLLEEFGLNYKIVDLASLEERKVEIMLDLLRRVPSLEFDRELPAK